jgi:hypothetical protein
MAKVRYSGLRAMAIDISFCSFERISVLFNKIFVVFQIIKV